MAGQGNVPKGEKENTTGPSGDSASTSLLYGSGNIDGLLDRQNKIYVTAVTVGSYTLTGGTASDWFYLAGALSSTSYAINGLGSGDWISFQSFARSGVTYDAFNNGVTINLGDAYYLTNGTLVAAARQFSGQSLPSNGTLVSIENAWGSSGDDIIVGSIDTNELHGGEGNDKIFGVGSNDFLYGEGGNDVMVGGSGNNSFNGGTGNDYMRSGLGNDWIEGGDPTSAGAGPAKTFRSNPDTNLSGGGLTLLNYGDSVDYSYLPAGWTVTLVLNGDIWVDATVYDEQKRVRERDKVKSVENIVGGSANDPLVGDNNGNLLDGGGGDDLIKSGGGNDLIIGGGGGNDDIDGGDGTDEISFVPIIDPIVDGVKYSPANNKLNDDKSLVLDLRLDDNRGRFSFNTVQTSAASNQPAGGPSMLKVSASTSNVDTPWRGAMSSIENVTGTEKNDQIAGTVVVNILNGYAGNDILYGAGGNDTLIGGEGNDWALFRDATPGNQPRYNDNALNIDPVFFSYNDINSPYGAGGTIRLAASTFGFSGSTGTISSVENVLGSIGPDTIVGDGGINILAGEAGKDVLYGGGANDRVFGGATAGGGFVTTKMNSLWGGAGADTLFIGFNYNPVVGTAKTVTVGTLTGVQNTYGALPTNAIETDYGLVRLDGKSGATNLDYHDVVNDWQTGDTLFLAKDWTVVIQGLGASNGTSYVERFEQGAQSSNVAYNWDGADQLDLRSMNGSNGNNENRAGDYGKIVVLTGAGDDTIYGSNGNDWIFAGSGLNTINLGSASDDGEDIVFIDTFLGKYNVTGFDSQDKVYIHRSVIDALSPGALHSRSLLGITQPGDGIISASIATGSEYRDEGRINPLSPLLFDVVYLNLLKSFPSYDPAAQPIGLTLPVVGTIFNEPLWTQNGAQTNQAHYYAELVADATLYATAALQILYGTALLPIPIVGTIIGGVLIASGATMIVDGTKDWQHRNTTYGDDANALQGLFSFMASQNPGGTSGSSVGSWEAKNFLDFYSIPNDRFMPTLEVTTHPVKEGIYTIASVYNGTESFIYLIFSPDRMIQNSEARLIAQINGQVAANQVVLYDDSFTDITRYSTASTEPAILAPEIISIVLAEDNSSIEPGADGLTTRDKTPTVTVTLSKAAIAGDVLSVTFGGQALADSPIQAGATTVTVALPSQNVDADVALAVSIVNSQGFNSSLSTVITIDTTAPQVGAYGITASASSIYLSTDEAGTTRFLDSGGNAVVLAPQGTDTVADANGYYTLNGVNSVTLTPAAQSSVRWIDQYELTDQLGNTDLIDAGDTLGSDSTTSIAPAIGLGTAGDDSIDGSSYGDAVIIGFAGNDTLTLGSGVKTVVFASSAASNGSDTIIGFSAGSSGDVLDFSAFLPTGSFSTGDHVVGNPAGATVGNGPLDATNKVVQVYSQGANTSTDCDEASEILGFFNTAGANGTILTLGQGGKAVVLTGEDTSMTNDAYVWFVHDANSSGTVELAEIVLVGTIDNLQLGTLFAGNIIV